jgi:molecular chaperone Hsp33
MQAAAATDRRADDLVQPFQIDAPGLRGRLVRLGASVDEVLSRHDYPEPVARLLGETLALAAALSGALKYDGVFSLQTKGDGPVRLMVADITSQGAMRGYAAFDEQALVEALASGSPPSAPLTNPVPRLLGRGHLAFTVDQGPDTERYQGIVELSGGTLADCAHHYFRQSEQLQAGIKLACDRQPGPDGAAHWRAGALMLQRLPEAEIDSGAEAVEIADDDWRRSLLLMGSSTTAELVDPALTPDQLLFRLFHEDGVRVYRAQPVRAGCRCSRERVTNMLRALPRDEVAELKIDDRVEVTCEFCNSRYTFTDPQLAEIYDA